jgi:spermidine synthase
MIDHYFPVDAPISVLHLGAGAMTLVRYIGARNPDALQVVVELEKDIVDLVESVVPLEVPAEIIYMDAGDAVRALPPKSFDLIISDVYVGIDTPDHLMTKEFYSNLDSLLLPYGVLLVNVTGKDGLEFIAEQYKTIRCIFSNTVIAIDNESFSSGGETNALVAASTEDSAILDLEFPKEHRPSTTIIPGDWSL